ncbi:MAG: quinoprotein relay system zinc metallohydrolase 2 [Pseudomonadota bacterium]
MFEVLLTVCLLADPAACRTERHDGGATREACAVEAGRLAAAVGADQQAERWPCVATGTTPSIALTEIAPGVFVHQGHHAEFDPHNLGDVANIGVVVGNRSVAVIDAGGSAAVAQGLLAAIREITALPISHVVLTHMHPDHSFGAATLAAGGAEIIGHAKLERALAARREHYLARARDMIGPAFAETDLATPDLAVEDSTEIDLGGRVLQLVAHATAHTDNDLTVYDRESGTLFLGDLLFLGHLPVIDGSVLGWLTVLDRLEAQPARRGVPGHGPVAVAWPEAAGPMRAYLETLVSEARAAIEAGMPIGEAAETLGHRSAAAWLLADPFAARNALTVYKELEWE